MMPTTNSETCRSTNTKHCAVLGNKTAYVRQLHAICVTCNVKWHNLKYLHIMMLPCTRIKTYAACGK